MLTTHNNATAVKNPVRAGRQFGSLRKVGDRQIPFLRSQHNRCDGSDNGNSGQEGEGEDKPISAHEPTKFRRGHFVVFGREDGK